MAEQIDNFEFVERRGRKQSYPWSDWLNGKPWRLKQGVDFKKSIESFRGLAYTAASRAGLTIKTFIESETVLVLCAYKGKPHA